MPVVLVFITGPIADREVMRMDQVFEGNLMQIFERPITLVLFVLSVLSIFTPLVLNFMRRRKQAAASG